MVSKRLAIVPIAGRERITETVYHNGRVLLNVVDAKGRTRTRDVTEHVKRSRRVR